MEKFDSDNLEDQIDELLAPTKPSSKSLSDIRSSTSKVNNTSLSFSFNNNDYNYNNNRNK